MQITVDAWTADIIRQIGADTGHTPGKIVRVMVEELKRQADRRRDLQEFKDYMQNGPTIIIE